MHEMGMRDGPGLKVLKNRERWYGPGYCGICGERGPELVPRAVRWWDPDDGWKMGVLCSYCLDEAQERGPRESDYAVAVLRERAQQKAERIDVTAELCDLDGAYSDQ